MNPLIVAIVLVTGTLVLRTGERIEIQGTPKEENGVVTFRSEGRLYSMPASEVERIEQPADEGADRARPVKKLKVTEAERRRLLEELEKNHGGQPAPRQKVLEEGLPVEVKSEAAESTASGRDEWSWRREARMHEESVLRAKEELQLLLDRIDELESRIHTFFALGYKPNQFSHQTLQLERAREQVPAARLAITRAEREYAQFREDARKQGVLPGWLR